MMSKRYTFGIKYTDGRVALVTVYASSDDDAEMQLRGLLPAGRIYWLEKIEVITGYAGGDANV